MSVPGEWRRLDYKLVFRRWTSFSLERWFISTGSSTALNRSCFAGWRSINDSKVFFEVYNFYFCLAETRRHVVSPVGRLISLARNVPKFHCLFHLTESVKSLVIVIFGRGCILTSFSRCCQLVKGMMSASKCFTVSQERYSNYYNYYYYYLM